MRCRTNDPIHREATIDAATELFAEGQRLQAAGRLDEAAAAFGQAAQADPSRPDADFALGCLYLRLGLGEQAIVHLDRVVAIAPTMAAAISNLGLALMLQGRHAEAMSQFRAAFQLRPDDDRLIGNIRLCAVYRDDLDDATMEGLHRAVGARLRRDHAGPVVADPRPDRCLRVGVLSSDLRNHPLARNLLPGLRHHDRDRVALHFYSSVDRPDAVTGQFYALAAGWHDVAALSDAAVAERIRADRIDILLSLGGSFDGNRPAMCARRAAPIQISLYDACSSGLDEMDYLLADPWLVPRGTAEFYSERPLRLPQLFIYDRPDDFPPVAVRREPGPPVFGCFNNPAKISPSLLRLWGRILAAVPESRLLLRYKAAYSSDGLCQRLLTELTAAGAAAAQVHFHRDPERTDDFRAAYDDVDVALDTFPFSGSTTSFEALGMGVPVVTRPTGRMAGRFTLAMLHALRLPELVAASDDDYVAIAVAMAGQVASWRLRRPEIRRRLADSPLCDGRRWARQMERLFRAVWRRLVAGPAGAPAACWTPGSSSNTIGGP